MKVPIFGGFLVENPTKKANRLKALLRGISLSEYGSEGFRVRLRGLSEYGSVAYLVERPARETQAEQYSDTVLLLFCKRSFPSWRAHLKTTQDFPTQDYFRKGRTWAIAVRRGSYKSLFLLNSGRFPLEKYGNSVLNFGSHKTV